MNRLEDFLMPSQKVLYTKLRRMFKATAITSKGSYILVPGEVPVMLVAHLDTVHKESVKQICKTQNGNILMSPQGIGGDDRCGVYALVKVHRTAEKKPWLLFTCDEEIGGVGARKFCEHHKKGKLPKELDGLKALVEIDRKGEHDAVYYECANDEFEAYITGKGFVTDWGSFSDISEVAPELGVAAVNLSSGYYNAHTLHEYINRNHLNATIERVLEIVADAAAEDFPKYEYVDSWDAGFDAGYSWAGHGGNDWKSFLRREYSGTLKNVPTEIRDEYEELLDFYTASELDALREEHGDNIIHNLYRSEFGYSSDEYEMWMQCDDDCSECEFVLRCPRYNNRRGGGVLGRK